MTSLRKAIAGASLAVTLAFGLCSAGAENPVDLDQGWNKTDDIAPWYKLTQGSRLMPLSWLEALEQADSTEPFLDAANIEKYRYLPAPDPPPAGLPFGLPLGFAVDSQDDGVLWTPRFRWKYGQGSRESWVGFNCSACHTEELEFQGQRLRIEGGPTLADFQGFMEALDRALVETRDQPRKFARFAAKVLTNDNTEWNRERYLRPALKRLVDWELGVERMNRTSLRYGYARLDAFGHIFNKVALVVAAHPTPNPANSPVRYPVLWNVPQEDFVQWNASAPRLLKTSPFGQFDAGALARNTGELIGVFGDIHPNGKSGFVTSIRIDSLVDVEHELGKLRPPKWPEALFGAPDPAQVASGKTLYVDHCVRCHALLPNGRGDLTTTISVIPAPPVETDTDLLAACNAHSDSSASGVLAGTPVRYAAGGAPLPAQAAKLSDLLSTVVIGVLKGQKLKVALEAGAALIGFTPPAAIDIAMVGSSPGGGATLQPSPVEQRLEQCRRVVPPLFYKTRPLDGIWAAAPYLHNGSVPTLHDLLSPPGLRPKTFWEGTRQFDPSDVGYAITKERTKENDFEFDATLPGNSNFGHDYGASNFSEQERMNLIAYLKTL